MVEERYCERESLGVEKIVVKNTQIDKKDCKSDECIILLILGCSEGSVREERKNNYGQELKTNSWRY